MRKGYALLMTVILTGVLLTLGVIITRMVYNGYIGSSLLLRREQAFWAAEGGLEKGKANLAHNANWYTDLPHWPENDRKWLRAAALGEQASLGQGQFKIVREKDKNCLYSVGVRGPGVVVLKVKFSLFPYKTLHWEEI